MALCFTKLELKKKKLKKEHFLRLTSERQSNRVIHSNYFIAFNVGISFIVPQKLPGKLESIFFEYKTKFIGGRGAV